MLGSALAPEMTFRELLAQVRTTTLGAYDHQELPFEKLVEELQPERSLSHNPLFQVMFTFQNLPAEKGAGTRAAGRAARGRAELRLQVLQVRPDAGGDRAREGLSAVLEYATDLFESGTIERMAAHYVHLLEHVLRRSGRAAGGIPLPAGGRARADPGGVERHAPRLAGRLRCTAGSNGAPAKRRQRKR